jgi:hypothetical protein
LKRQSSEADLSLVTVSEREESEGVTDYVYRITVTALDCRECGGQRLATRPCPECGALPDEGETDPILERRRRIAGLALDALREPYTEAVSGAELPSVLTTTWEMVCPGFLAAFTEVANGGEDASELISTVSSLRGLQAEVEQDRPRPWRSLGRTARKLLRDVFDAFELLLGALMVDDVPAIQERMAVAQAALDSAAARTEKVRDDFDSMVRFFDATPDDALPLICELALRNLPEPEDDSSRIFELDAFGAGYVRRITGPESEPSTGFGIGIMLSVVAIEVLLDVERVYQVACQAYQDYLRGERLEELGANPEWVASQHDAQKWVQAGIRNLHALVAIARDDWAAARAVLLHAQDLIEGPIRHLLATYLAITKGREYQQLVSRDSNALLQQCRQAAADDLFGDISEDLRNASAHLRYRIDGEDIVLDPDRRPVRWSASTFIDKALATAETALALDLALACALDHFGHDTAISPDLTALGFDEVGQGLAVLIMTGWKEPTFDIQGDRATATGVALMNGPMTLTGSLLPSLPDDVRILELSVRSGGATRTFVADLMPLRRYAALPPSPDDTIGEHELAFVEGCARATLDGRPFASRDALRHYVAVLVGEAIVGEPSAAIGRLKQLQEFANRLDDHECAQAIFEVIRAVRLQVMGHGFDAAARHGIDALAEWEAISVEEPFAT